VIERIAVAPSSFPPPLGRFPEAEIAPIANSFVGTARSARFIIQSHAWLIEHPDFIDEAVLAKRLEQWRKMTPAQVTEPFHLLHRFGSEEVLAKMCTYDELYNAPGPILSFKGHEERYGSFSEIALIGLGGRDRGVSPSVLGRVYLKVLRGLVNSGLINQEGLWNLSRFLRRVSGQFPWGTEEDVRELASLARRLTRRLEEKRPGPFVDETVADLKSWADYLESTLVKDPARRSSARQRKA
jgi:hypothetical protein